MQLYTGDHPETRDRGMDVAKNGRSLREVIDKWHRFLLLFPALSDFCVRVGYQGIFHGMKPTKWSTWFLNHLRLFPGQLLIE